MPSIVVGVARSPSAPAIAAVGDRLASAVGLELMLVHATTGAEPCGELLEQADPRRGVGSRRSVAVGDPSDLLPRIARENDAALLVIGTGTYRPMRKLLHRGRANAVARAAPCPVVLVSPAAANRERSPQPAVASGIVCAIDGSPEARRVAEVAAALAAATLQRLVLVHSPSASGQDPVEELWFPHPGCEIATRRVDARPSEWLEVIGAEENAAVAVINGRERRARSVGAWASRPVVAVPPKAATEAIDTLTRLRSVA